jgi:hypothetical protein
VPTVRGLYQTEPMGAFWSFQADFSMPEVKQSVGPWVFVFESDLKGEQL